MKKLLILFSVFGLVFGSMSAQETKVHLAQISASGAINGQVPVYNSTSEEYEPTSISTGTDDQTVDQFDITSNTLNLSLEGDGQAVNTVDLSTYLDNTDTQDLTLTGNTLAISGDPNTDVDLSSYLDNTDTQNLGYTAETGALTLTDGGNVTILVSAQYTEEIFSSLTSGNTVTITGVLPSNLDGVVVTRGGLVQRRGATFDFTTSGQVVIFGSRDFQHGETVIVKYSN